MITVLKRFLLIMNPTMKELDFFGGSTLREPRVWAFRMRILLTSLATERCQPTNAADALCFTVQRALGWPAATVTIMLLFN
jgi:hypothetical protein